MSVSGRAQLVIVAELVLSILISGPTAEPSGRTGGLVYGPDGAFSLSPPKGWLSEVEPGEPGKMAATFRPEGSSWKDSKVVMYVTTATRRKDLPLETFIAAEVSRFQYQNPGMKVSSGASLTASDKRTVPVRRFSGDKWGNLEAVAYLQEETMFVTLVLSATDETAYTRSYDAFAALVASYTPRSKAA